MKNEFGPNKWNMSLSRIMSAVVTIAMVLSLLPSQGVAWALDEYATPEEEPVAQEQQPEEVTPQETAEPAAPAAEPAQPAEEKTAEVPAATDPAPETPADTKEAAEEAQPTAADATDSTTTGEEGETSKKQSAVTVPLSTTRKKTVRIQDASPYTVTINMKDYNGTDPYAPTSESLSGSYYIRIKAHKKGDASDTYYAVKPVTLIGNSTATVSVNGLQKTSEGFNNWETSDTYTFASNEFEIDEVRLINNSNGNASTYEQVCEADDYVDGMKFLNSEKTNASATIDLQRWNGSKLLIDVSTVSNDISQADGYWIKVTLEHKSDSLKYTYFAAPLDTSSVTGGTLSIEANQWYDGNQNLKDGEKFTGHEVKVSVQLLKFNADKIQNASVQNAIKADQNDVTVLSTGQYVKNYKYVSATTEVAPGSLAHTDQNYSSEYKATVTLQQVSTSNDYNYQTILNSAVNYGITADRFEQQGHDIQSNFATNNYEANGKPVNPNLSGDSAGAIAIANYVTFTDPASTTGFTADENGTVWISDTNEKTAVLYTDSADRLDSQSNSQYVHVVPTSAADVKSTIVDPALDEMVATSAELLTHDSNIAPTIAANNDVTIDASGYPDGATIYVDADSLADKCFKDGGSTLTIRKKPNQVIVFNFANTTKIHLKQYNVVNIDPDTGNTTSATSAPNTAHGSDINIALDSLTKHVVWNMSKATDVEFNGTAGIFLLPQPTSVAKTVNTASTGWIVTKGYFTNEGGEWHFVYGALPDANISTTNKTFEVKKNYNNWAEGDSFTFKLTAGTNDAVGSIATPMPAGSTTAGGETSTTVTIGESDSATYQKSFGAITYSVAGTYNYTLQEVNPSDPIENVSYDSKVYYITVAVTAGTDGKLSANVTYKVNNAGDDQTASGAFEFTNTYSAPTVQKGSLKITKNVKVNDADTTGTQADGTYKFAVYKGEDTNGDKVQDVELTITNGAASFETIDNLEPGKYTIAEVSGGTGKATPSDPASGNITVEVKAGKTGNEAVEASFTNNINLGSLEITKNFTGDGALTDTEKNAIKFTIAGPNSYSVEKTYANFTGDTLTLSNLPLGDYTVTESNATKTGYTLTTSYTVDGTSKTEAKATVTKGGTARIGITNTYTAQQAPSCTATLGLKKAVVGNTDDANCDASEKFKFVLSKDKESETTVRTGTDDVLPDNKQIEVTAGSNGAAGDEADFGEITFTKAGDYYYKIEEQLGSTVGMSYNGVVYAKVTVSGTDTLTPTVFYSTDGTNFSSGVPTVTNTYLRAESSLKATKTLTGKDLTNGQFSFSATLKDSSLPSGVDATNLKTTASNDAEGKVSFGTLVFTKDGATCTYIVEETSTDGNGITVDASKYEVTFKASKNASTNMLEVTQTINKKLNETETTAEAVSFENTYTAANVTVKFTGNKELEGATLEKDQFSFTVTPDPSNPTEGETKAFKSDIKNGNGANASVIDFGSVTYSKIGTWKYVFKETVGSATGIRYDSKQYEVTVKVEDDTNGNLVAKVTGEGKSADGKNADQINFKNYYSTVPLTSVSITKQWANDTAAQRPTLDAFKTKLHLWAGNEDVTSSYKNNLTIQNADTDTWTITWAGLPAKSGEDDITYTVSEDTISGYLPNTAKVNADGTLTNTGTSVSISKVDIDGGAEVAGAKLQILDADGKVVEAWESGKDGEKVHEVKGLEVGKKYTLHEEVAPDGYTVATDTYFTIDSDGKVSVEGSKTKDISGKTVILVEDAKTKVRISKVDIANDEEVAGAKIQILDKGGKVVESWTSTTEAHVIEGLKTGVEYTLHEEVAPEGYTIATDTTFTIDETGEVTSTGNTTKDSAGNTVLLVKDAKTKVCISKVDIADGKEVAGAHIQILDKETGKVVELNGSKVEWVSGDKGAHEVEGLLTDKEYILRETVAPDGYAITSDTTFSIDKTGKVTSTGTVSKDGVILVEDAKTEVKISKVDVTNGDKELAGAKIQVLDAAGKKVDEWTSTTKPHIIQGLIAGKTYTLHEEIAPDGYTKATDTTFTLKADGTIDTAKTKTTAVVKDGILIVQDACPALEKYINKDVHQDLPAFDTPFTYDILAYVPKNSKRVVISDGLVAGVSFNTTSSEVKVQAIGPNNDHTAHGTVEQAKGTDIKEAKVTLNGKKLTVDIPDAGKYVESEDDYGYWVRVTYNVKLDNSVVSDSSEYIDNDVDVAENKTVISNAYPNGTSSHPSHDGVVTNAQYVVYLEGDEEEQPSWELVSNDITVTPPTETVKVTKVWKDADGKDIDWPKGAKVTVELLGNGKSLDEVTTEILGEDKAIAKQTVELSADKTSDTFVELPIYEAITYSIAETSVTGVPSGYSTAVTGSVEEGFTVTNTVKKAEKKDEQKKDEQKKKEEAKKATTTKTTKLATTGDALLGVAVPYLASLGSTLMLAGTLHKRRRRK